MRTASKEPLISVANLTAFGAAVLAAATAFGLDLTADQTAAVVGLLAVVVPYIVAWAGRSRVYSPATVQRIKAAQAPRNE